MIDSALDGLDTLKRLLDANLTSEALKKLSQVRGAIGEVRKYLLDVRHERRVTSTPTENNRARLAERKAEGKLIDPETAIIWCRYGYLADPYGEDPALPDDCRIVGRVYFARRPTSDIWVCFEDLPHDVVQILWNRMECRRNIDDLPF